MTFKEKLMQEHPEIANRETFFLYYCPSTFNYEEVGIRKQICFNIENCSECWDREVPEELDNDPKVIEQFANTPNNCAQSPDDIRKALEIAEKMNDDTQPHILDSGTRREFETGAVRDIQAGKGRCDLLPLDVVAEFMSDPLLLYISRFQEDGAIRHLYDALTEGILVAGFQTNFNMLLEVAKHFEEGCNKYGDNNWQKGIPTKCYIDSAVRHYLKYLRGDKDEPHDRAFCWNILCCIWTCIHKPELNEYGKED